jgi:hypothetical protein
MSMRLHGSTGHWPKVTDPNNPIAGQNLEIAWETVAFS